MKICPFCAEEIQEEALVCRYCGRGLAKKSKDKIQLIFGEITIKRILRSIYYFSGLVFATYLIIKYIKIIIQPFW
jgi:uncharacterized membrane protein YvbJ